MTQEEKQLLLKDICARLLYDVQVKVNIPYVNIDFDKDYDYITNLQNNCILTLNNISDIQKITDDIKPYLRPMSSMTEEERKEFPYPYYFEWINSDFSLLCSNDEVCASIGFDEMYEIMDWLNAHHFDYRRLIDKGLALEALKDMYKTKRNNYDIL